MDDRVTIGTLADLQRAGCLTGKAGAQPVCVFWSDGAPFALDDRCPHMGFPLHRGTVESGLVTCHWHNARFDLRSGGTLDPWADDVRAYPVEIDGDSVVVVVSPAPDRRAQLQHRLEEGLEQGISLVTAKAVLGLLDAGVPVGRSCGRGSPSAPVTGRPGGAPASPSSPPWPTCCPTSTPPTVRWPWWPGWPSCPGTPGAGRPASPCSRWRVGRRRRSSRAGTGASSRRGRPTPRSGRWPRRSPSPAPTSARWPT